MSRFSFITRSTALAQRITAFFRLHPRNENDHERELVGLEERKLVLENARLRLENQAIELESLIARELRSKKKYDEHLNTHDRQAVDGHTRRNDERVRWKETQERNDAEQRYLDMLAVLRETDTEIRNIRMELVDIEAKCAGIERAAEEERIKRAQKRKPERTRAPDKTKEHHVLPDDALIAKKRMRARDLLALALRTFRVKFGMTMLTVLGIGVSFATIFFFVSMGYGLERLLLSQFASETLLRTLDVSSPNPDVVPLDRSALERLAALPGVEYIEPITEISGHIASPALGLATEVVFRGVTAEHFSVAGGVLKEGRVYRAGEHELVISSGMLQVMGKTSVGDFSEPFSVVLYISDGSASGGATPALVAHDFRVVGIVEDEEHANTFLSPELVSDHVSHYGVVKILVGDQEAVEGLRVAISESGFMSGSVLDTVEQATKVFRIAEIVLSLFGVAALVVATIGMVNTMTVSLLERTQEIGMMKVLGVADGDVRKLFLLEASIIGGLGGLSGLVMGFALSQGFNIFINFLAKNLGGTAVSLFYYPSWFILAIALAAAFVGFLTGLVPSRRAAHMDPINAVKYK